MCFCTMEAATAAAKPLSGAAAAAAAAAAEASKKGQKVWPWSDFSNVDVSLFASEGLSLEKLCLLERPTHTKIKNRSCLYTPAIKGDLAKAAAEILNSQTKTIVLLLGSSSNTNMWPPTDTDTTGGACALAAALWRLHKHVILVTGNRKP